MFIRVAFISLVTTSILFSSLLKLSGKITKVDANGISEDKVKMMIKVKEGDIYSVSRLKSAQHNLKRALKQVGYVDAKVTVDSMQQENGIKVIFNVDKGDPIKVKKVTFIGNHAISTTILEDVIVNKPGGIFSWFLGDGIAMPAMLEYDRAKVRDEYLKRGYLDVEIDKPLMKTNLASKSASITFRIRNEGKRYTVTSIEVTPVPNLDITKIRKKFKLKQGKVFNIKSLRDDLNMLIEKAGDKGYAFANIQPKFKKNDEAHTIDIMYEVNLGQKVRIHDIKISGNIKTKEHVVRRYLYLAPGDQFNLTDLKDSKKELQRSGYFDSTEIIPKRVSGDSIDLEVAVEEARTGSILGGLSYGTRDGFGVNASLSERNIFGTGIGYNLSLEKSEKSYDYSISLKNPRVFDTLYSLSIGLFDQSYEFIDYNKEEKGAYASVGRKLTKSLSSSIGFIYSSIRYSDYNKTKEPNWNVVYKSYKKRAVTSSTTFDNTDDYFTPRKGIYSKLNIEYSGFGDKVEYANYVKTELKFATYYGMKKSLGYDLILRYKLRAGYIKNIGSTPRAERLFLGGSSWGVRGFYPASLSPLVHPGDADSPRKGGYKSLVNTLEVSIPISFIKNMRLTAFVDYGMIGDRSLSEIKRVSVGAEIEWRSPIGPVNFIFAKPINKKTGDKTSIFEFTISGKF